VEYNASSVPVLQISLSSDTLNEQQLYDYGLYNLRQRLAPIHGVTFPTPAGGKYRQIMVDLDPAKLLAKGLTPLDVANAVNAQNLTLPSGAAKIGDTQYTVRTNAVPATINDLNNRLRGTDGSNPPPASRESCKPYFASRPRKSKDHRSGWSPGPFPTAIGR